jgi:hypothetical protein
MFSKLPWFYVTLQNKIALHPFMTFTQVDFLSILSHTFGRPPRLLLIHEYKHFDTKLAFIRLVVVPTNLNFGWFKILRAFEPMGSFVGL